MKNLTTEAKEAIVLQAINRGDLSIKEIAERNHVGYSALKTWVRNAQSGLPMTKKDGFLSGTDRWSEEEKFTHLLATDKLDEVTLGKYCREHGLYSHQLTNWRKAFMQKKSSTDSHQNKSDLMRLRSENKKLKKELRHKEKALAEASALLILKKKADWIWGEARED